MAALGMSAAEIDIRPAAERMLKDIGHPFARGQAHLRRHLRERPGRRAHLAPVPSRQPARRTRARHGRPVRAGTRVYDLRRRRSHVALQRERLGPQDPDPAPDPLAGADAPVRRTRRWQFSTASWRRASRPSWCPVASDAPTQSSEDVVGPYELQDFNLYYLSRFGYPAEQGRFPRLECLARPQARGVWPDTVAGVRASRVRPADDRAAGSRCSCCRFFETSQFKRSAMPNGPKVGSGGSLSPRSDWRAPSDAPATVWLAELRDNVPSGTPRRRRR